MIVLTLAGLSTRFFSKGYSKVKFLLPWGKVTLIQEIISYIPRAEKFLIILNKNHDIKMDISIILNSLGFKDFFICEIENSQGQMDSLFNGLSIAKEFFSLNEALTVFNGDTIRKSNNWSNFKGDIFIETFKAEGSHWSFVNKLGYIDKIEEKNRISDFCSNGLYYFKKAEYVLNYFENFKNSFAYKNEMYVSFFINYLLNFNLKAYSELIDSDKIILCGKPDEYEKSLKQNFKNA